MELFEIINQYGFMTAFSCLVLYFGYRYGMIRLNRLTGGYKELKGPSLTSHPLFSDMKFMINNTIPNIKIQCPLRNEIFKDFLKIKFNVFFKKFVAQASEVESNPKMGVVRLRSVFMDGLSDAITEYESKARAAGIPGIVIEKFNKWHSQHVLMTHMTIDKVFGSKFISTTREQVAVVFGVYRTVFALTIIDAETTLNSLNGELDKVAYKDKRCVGQCHDCPRRDKIKAKLAFQEDLTI